MGGEKIPANAPPLCPVGSPPRGRGKALILALACASSGITPAWAGKRQKLRRTAPRSEDYPRVGGEKVMCNSRDGARLGSPPRGRGKVTLIFIRCFPFGITPAWAGKSSQRTGAATSCQDHPRVGGEKISICAVWLDLLGSPPRGRGKACPADVCFRHLGITPAWAGKRKQEITQKNKYGDHPRVGGEKYRFSRTSTCTKGSPPRGRGKVLVTRSFVSRTGITPAWAGKSLSRPPAGGRVRDHPRVGGEKCYDVIPRFGGVGSPPRGRGKGQSEALNRVQSGITPAWAGKRVDQSKI